MAEKGWTAVEKPNWETDVFIVKELNGGLAAMNGANSFELLTGYYEAQKANAKYLMPEGRKKWEQAYAYNVLRLTKPEAVRPATIYVAVTAEAKGEGKYDYAEVAVYDSFRAAVRMTVATLVLAGELYRRMAPADVAELKAAVEAEDWPVAYDVLRQKLRGMLVTVMPQVIAGDDTRYGFTLAPEHGTVAGVWPYTRVRHSAIEYRYGEGGKGDRGVYLVAEQEELSGMLRGAGRMTTGRAARVLARIADRLEQDAARGTDPAALAAWREYVEEMADDEEDAE